MKLKRLGMVLLCILLTGCSLATTDENNINASENATSGYPITIEHAFGRTVIEKKPERVASIAWGNHDVALALGIIPVGLSKGNFDELGIHGLAPWTEQAFLAAGVNEPTVYDDLDGLDFEAIADSRPDVILAAYSGITQEDYDTLSKIAPVIAYPKQAWQTNWREQTMLNATAMGLKAEGEALVDETEKRISDQLAKYPEIIGKSGAFLWLNAADTSQFYAYLLSDPRAAYLTDLGLQFPESLKTLANKDTEFSITLSAEQADRLTDIDIIVTYGDDSTLAVLQKDPLLGKVPAIANGAVVVIDQNSALAGSTTPTILGIPYTIDEYLTLIHEAALKVK